jgi:hypothetical protein
MESLTYLLASDDRVASNQNQHSDRQNGHAHDGEQAGGHELAGLHDKAIAKEDGQQALARHLRLSQMGVWGN